MDGRARGCVCGVDRGWPGRTGSVDAAELHRPNRQRVSPQTCSRRRSPRNPTRSPSTTTTARSSTFGWPESTGPPRSSPAGSTRSSPPTAGPPAGQTCRTETGYETVDARPARLRSAGPTAGWRPANRGVRRSASYVPTRRGSSRVAAGPVSCQNSFGSWETKSPYSFARTASRSVSSTARAPSVAD